MNRTVLVATLLVLSCLACASQAQTSVRPGDLAELYRLDLWPTYRHQHKVGMISSYDRTGGNDDGFSGRYSFVRKEGDGLVIADLKGPGVIRRIWTPTPTDDPMEFYFDGEETPRIKTTWRGIFMGDQAPFLAPMVGYGSGGFYSYTPLPYQKSCKVIIRAPRVQFYQINYSTFPPGSIVETYTRERFDAQKSDLARAIGLWGMAGKDLSASSLPPGADRRMERRTVNLFPGRSARVFEARRGGRIAGIRLAPATALAGKDRRIKLRIYFDGDKTPAVDVPAGDFFGFAWGRPSMRALPAGVHDNVAYCYMPMPYDRSARVELVDERESGDSQEVQCEVVHSDVARFAGSEGRFYGVWNRENPTTIGKSFTYLEHNGKGHVVGVMLQAQGLASGSTPFFEGDDQCTIDGELAAHGTGSEDSFNGGWYDVPGRWEGPASYPLSGCLDYNRPQARSGGFRFFLTDALAYSKSILFAIEHAPEKNDIQTDYTSTTFLYSDSNPNAGQTPTPPPARAVKDLSRLVFTPGWYIPIHSFSIRNASLTKADGNIDGQRAEWLTFRTQNEDIFGPHHLSLLCSVPASGRYRVSIEALEGPQGGIVQLFQNERAIGEKVDLYAEARRRSKLILLGEQEMNEGPNQVFLKLLGKNPKAESAGLDLISVVLERL